MPSIACEQILRRGIAGADQGDTMCDERLKRHLRYAISTGDFRISYKPRIGWATFGLLVCDFPKASDCLIHELCVQVRIKHDNAIVHSVEGSS